MLPFCLTRCCHLRYNIIMCFKKGQKTCFHMIRVGNHSHNNIIVSSWLPQSYHGVLTPWSYQYACVAMVTPSWVSPRRCTIMLIAPNDKDNFLWIHIKQSYKNEYIIRKWILNWTISKLYVFHWIEFKLMSQKLVSECGGLLPQISPDTGPISNQTPKLIFIIRVQTSLVVTKLPFQV